MKISTRSYAEQPWVRRKKILLPNVAWLLAIVIAGVVTAAGIFLGPAIQQTQQLEQVTLTFGAGTDGDAIKPIATFTNLGVQDDWTVNAANGYSTAKDVHLIVKASRAGGFTSCTLEVQQKSTGASPGYEVLTATLVGGVCEFHPASGQAMSKNIAAGASFTFELRHKWSSFPDSGGTVTLSVQSMEGVIV